MKASTEPTPPWRGPRALAALLAVLALALALIRFRIDLAGGVFGWRLAPAPESPYPPASLVPSLLVLAACATPVAVLMRRPGAPSRRGAAGALCCLGLLCFGWQQTSEAAFGARGWVGNTVASTCSTISNGYFLAALAIDDVPAFLRDYDAIQRLDTGKLSTHPPGATLLYRAALATAEIRPIAALASWMVEVTGGSAVDVRIDIARFPNVPPSLDTTDIAPALWCALVLSMLAATAVVPTYLLGAAGGDRRCGLLAAALLAVMPNVAFYRLSLDGLLMMLAAWCVAGVQMAVLQPRRAIPWAMVSGVALGLFAFTSLGAAPTALLAAAWLALAWRGGEVTRRQAIAIALAACAGVLLVLGTAALAGLAVPTVYRQALELHRHGAGGIGYRQYLPWLMLNPVDYAVFAGLPVCIVAGEGIVRRDLAGPPLLRTGLVLLAVLVLLNLSGTVRAETERLWLFFNPLLAASAAAAAVGREARLWPLAAQPLQALLMMLAMPPLVRPY